jgi:hypothetical protein
LRNFSELIFFEEFSSVVEKKISIPLFSLGYKAKLGTGGFLLTKRKNKYELSCLEEEENT